MASGVLVHMAAGIYVMAAWVLAAYFATPALFVPSLVKWKKYRYEDGSLPAVNAQALCENGKSQTRGDISRISAYRGQKMVGDGGGKDGPPTDV